MGVFFGFGNAQLSHSVFGNNFAVNVFELFRRKNGFHKAVVVNLIFSHADAVREFYDFVAGKAFKFVIA